MGPGVKHIDFSAPENSCRLDDLAREEHSWRDTLCDVGDAFLCIEWGSCVFFHWVPVEDVCHGCSKPEAEATFFCVEEVK